MPMAMNNYRESQADEVRQTARSYAAATTRYIAPRRKACPEQAERGRQDKTNKRKVGNHVCDRGYLQKVCSIAVKHRLALAFAPIRRFSFFHRHTTVNRNRTEASSKRNFIVPLRGRETG